MTMATLYYVSSHATRDERVAARDDAALLPKGKYDVTARIDVGDIGTSPADCISAADALFERFNIGDRAGLSVRSMSVGDVVAFDGRAIAMLCCKVGWRAVPASRLPEPTKAS
ncbi:MAG TPA: hypothetical protein VMW52_04655 [Phycisphaerae bacterium]|nr:hypothetical protein [Polyangiales bacterium]HUX15739.1 hypothetical protein [Phycisphaerae bacterium]